LLQAGYTTIRDAIVSDGADEPDDGIAAFLPTAAQFSALLPSGFSPSSAIVATKANLKALGACGSMVRALRRSRPAPAAL
jgi:hypothetical protein